MLRQFMGLGGLVLAGLLTLGGAACNSDEKPQDETPPDPYPTFDKFCDAIAEAECVAPVRKACALNNEGAEQACREEVANGCKSKSIDLTRDVKSTTNYRKEKAADCIAAVGAVYATAQITSANHITLKATCQPVFRGSQTKGFACDDDNDCAVDLGCYRANLSDDKGECQTINTKTIATSCSSVGDVCGSGLYCAELAKGGKVCIEGGDSGADCSSDVPCKDGYICADINTTSGQGKCSAKKPSSSSSSCTSDEECVSGFCAQLGAKQACLDVVGLAAGAPVCDNFDGQ